MILKNWKTWLIGAILLVVVLGGVSVGLNWRGVTTAGTIVSLISGLIIYLWLSWGMFYWRAQKPVYWSAVIFHGTAVAIIVFLILAKTGKLPLAVGLLGFWILTVCFFVGMWLARAFLSLSNPIFSIARTVLDEAVRMKVGLIFIVLILLVVPCFPIAQDFSERLQYRMQAYLTWSTLLVSMLLSLMSVFLGAWTVCSEIKDKQIYLSLSKPVRRIDYILGKWLGLAMLNLVLVVVAGGGIYVFARVLETTPAKELSDKLAIREQVLVARGADMPVKPSGNSFQEAIGKRIKELQTASSRLYGEEKDGVTPKVIEAATQQVITEWLTLTPGANQTYRYTGLLSAKKPGTEIQLRMKPNLSPRPDDDLGMMYMYINGQMITPQDRPLVVLTATFQTFPIPAELIRPDGTLDITLINISSQPDPSKGTVASSISFNPVDGLEILYPIDSFENNLLRMMIIVWFRVIFLSIVGVMAGTFLGFPVAALLGTMILLVAYSSGFLLESLNAYASIEPMKEYNTNKMLWPFLALYDKLAAGDIMGFIRQCVRMFGEFFVFLVPSFSKHDPGPLIADGRIITWNMVGQAVLMIGIVWSGVVCLLAWLMFWLKELARVIV